MKKRKRLISALLVSALAVSAFAGCGNSSKRDDNTFYIGGIGPVTGDAAIYGTAVQNGAQIAVDEINAAGGINGAKIAYKFEDDQNDPEKSVNAYNTLKDWGMQVLMGTVTSAPCVAVASETGSDNMFQITPSASSTDVIKGDNVFQVCFTDPNQGVADADYIADNQVGDNIAIIYDSSDVYSSGIEKAFVEEAGNKGLSIVSETAFTSDTKTDFSTQLQKAKDAKAELVFLPIYYKEAAAILQQADSMDYHPTFVGCDGLDGLLSVEGFDKSLAEGVILITPFSTTANEESKKFTETYQEKYNDTPNQFAADAYDSIYAIKAAIEKAGVKPDAAAADMKQPLCDAVQNISIDGLTGSGMTWSASGEISKTPIAVVIKDGEYTGM
ncbi:MAG: ABC transporter substrate-binding protein [Lachnospiraceae bacterium]